MYSSTQVSSVLYELKTAAGVQVLPAHTNFAAPTETELEILLPTETATGTTYTLETTVRSTLNLASHTTASSSTLLRRSECMQVVVEGSFAPDNMPDIQTQMESLITTVGTVDASNVVMASYESVLVAGFVQMFFVKFYWYILRISCL